MAVAVTTPPYHNPSLGTPQEEGGGPSPSTDAGRIMRYTHGVRCRTFIA